MTDVGLVRDDAAAGSRAIARVGAGRPALAVDVGGTLIKSAIVDASGLVQPVLREATPRGEDAAVTVVDAVAALFERARSDHPELDLSVIGLAVPGVVDEIAGVGVWAENLGWTDAPLRVMLEALTGATVVLVHDVRAAGAAETRLGAATGFQNTVTVAIGTGVSAAISCDGQLIRANGYAGEIGHLRVGGEEVECVCGGVGCLESIASASAIVKRYRHLSGDDAVTGADEVIARAESGDPIARRVWDDALDGLAAGLAALVATVAPEVIVIAGGLSGAGDSLLRPLAERIATRVRIVPRPALAVARFGSDAGIVGAALATRTAP